MVGKYSHGGLAEPKIPLCEFASLSARSDVFSSPGAYHDMPVSFSIVVSSFLWLLDGYIFKTEPGGFLLKLKKNQKNP